MPERKEGISVFFPCYNDEKSIKILVENTFQILKKLANIYEVIVIDDGSTDHSREVLLSLQKKYNELKLIFHPQNTGYGGTLQSGFNAAKYHLIFYTDGDGQYDMGELPLLLSVMTKDIDFVNGIKMSRHDPTYRVVLGNIYSLLVRWLFWVPVIDVDCDFRLIRSDLAKKIKLTCQSGAVCIELVKKAQNAGAKFRQISVKHLKRKNGQSQFFRADRLFLTLLELIQLWFQLMIFKKA